ncbi:MAG: sialate O-acetylesterase [Lentisphaeria bacterium]
MKKILLSTFILLTCSMIYAQSSTTNVFILTGQSNSLGIIKDGEPLDLAEQPEDKKIKFFWIDRDHAARIVSTSNNEIKYLQVQKFDNGANDGHWGLEINCFRILSKSIKNILLVKVSRGGGGSGFWFKDSKDCHMYTAVTEAMKQVNTLMKGRNYEVRGLLYLQGESDGGDSSIADQRAETLLENLRNDLHNAKKMKMYIGGIAGFNANQNLVRKKHAELAAKNNDIFFIETEDLLKTNLYRDRLHFNNEAKMIIGERFAKSILQSVKKSK